LFKQCPYFILVIRYRKRILVVTEMVEREFKSTTNSEFSQLICRNRTEASSTNSLRSWLTVIITNNLRNSKIIELPRKYFMKTQPSFPCTNYAVNSTKPYGLTGGALTRQYSDFAAQF